MGTSTHRYCGYKIHIIAIKIIYDTPEEPEDTCIIIIIIIYSFDRS